MARRTKEELRLARNEKRITELIANNKFLREPKYYKNNYWSWAAWDSWAAKGKAGSCGCGCGYYNGTLHNKRAATRKGRNYDFDRGKRWPVDISSNLCYDCVNRIEEKINFKFKKH